MHCPDNDSKRLARFYLYRRAKMLWAAGGTPAGQTLVLAGDEASEIGCLRDYLSLPPNTVCFVDNDKKGLDVVKRVWSQSQRFHGPIEDAIPKYSPLKFINFDFCGYVSDKTLPAVEVAAKHIRSRGIVSYTFARDRENPTTPNWEAAKAVTEKIVSKDPRFRSIDRKSSDWLDTVRFVGYSSLLQAALGRHFETIFLMRYREDNRRSMGIVAFQYMPPSLRTPAWRKELNRHHSHEERIGSINAGMARTRLRDIAMKMTDRMSTREVAFILHLSPGTLSAWQAHKTRGTYLPDGGGEES